MELDVVLDDGIKYLKSVESTDGIFAGQVVEHLTIEQILELCDIAYEKLASGSYLVIETPNPTSLAIYTNAFYMDPSHVKPVHPLTLKYCLEKCGFHDIDIIYTEASKLEALPMLKCSDSENIDEFNRGIQRISQIMFGSQDYAIVAKK
jgi:O-antigen chain-terminating methyltransferase